MKNIEVEIRSFVEENKFHEVIERLKKEGKFLGEDTQVTHYFAGPVDVRIQQNNEYAKIWLKGGKLHDDAREETEIRVPRDDFEKLEHLFSTLGFEVEIKWFRTRRTFKWQGIVVTVDYTRGYGYIIELEEMADEDRKEEALLGLRAKMKKLEIEQTPREEFDIKYADYKKNWRELTKIDK